MQSALSPAHQLCWDQLERDLPWLWQGVSAGPDILLPPGPELWRVDAVAQGEAGIAAEWFVPSGRTTDSMIWLVIPLWHPGTRCWAGAKVHEEFVVSGLGPLSDQRVQVPFQILPLGEL